MRAPGKNFYSPNFLNVNDLSEQNWFHGPLDRATACSRLLNDGSFLVTNDENDPAKFCLFVKWNGQDHEIDINYNVQAEKYGLGSVEFTSIADLLTYYKDNQLPVREDLGAILFMPVPLPRDKVSIESESSSSEELKNNDYASLDDVVENHKSFNGQIPNTNHLNFSKHTSKPPVVCRLQRRQVRYLPMNEKPPKYKNKNLNKSLGNLRSIYCDPSNFSQSTISLPTASDCESSFQRLTKMCQGLVNYDLALTFLNFVDVAKPLDEDAFSAVTKVILSAAPETVADCLANETASILVLNWLSDSGNVTGLPTDGYSLLLWPAANGFRWDLYNRDRFLTLFLISSIVILKDGESRAKLLAVWVDVIKRLIDYHKDYFTANVLVNGICSDQIMNQKHLWEKAFPCEDNPDIINRLKTYFAEYRIQETSLFEVSSGCLSTVDRCVPNIAPLVADLYHLQPPDVDAGGLPPAPLMQKLSVAKSIYQRRKCGGRSGALWVRQRWLELQSVHIPDELQSIFKTENILLLLLGPIDVRQNDILEGCYKKLLEILSILADV
ncbi:hypothetical protein Aperf_G00000027025 [Anoplocephala perfoliata]